MTAGEPGVPGDRGPTGPPGPKGIPGESGKVGVTFIRWGRKTCPNSGATLVYEGNINILHPVKNFLGGGAKPAFLRQGLSSWQCPVHTLASFLRSSVSFYLVNRYIVLSSTQRSQHACNLEYCFSHNGYDFMRTRH